MNRVFALLLFPAVAGAQNLHLPASTSLRWQNLRVVMSPDSGGLYFWANTGRAGDKPGLTYGAAFDPAAAYTWVADARGFLERPVTEADTGTTRSSVALPATLAGGRMYLVRRRVRGQWTKERFMVLESADISAEPVIINTDERNLRDILDSLEAVSRRSPPMRLDVLRDSSGRAIEFDQPASPKPGNRPPPYPEDEQRVNHEGVVVLKFVVGTDGKADMTTLRVVHSEAPAFLESVIKTLPRLRFNPAIARGMPVRQLVVMPFDFGLVR